ncbi:MAG TPA: Rieske 2Fe-2S domain-containing protein [Hanamia sp.]|nr:Rieske 2Fe-2S domain-containing protein [Hanamia sp.]
MEKNENWIKIASSKDEIRFRNNDIAKVKVAGKEICVIQTSNGLKGCNAYCPHAGGKLSKGFLDNKGNIICPVHHYRFNLINGRDTNNEGYFLKIYKVVENEDGIFVGLEK